MTRKTALLTLSAVAVALVGALAVRAQDAPEAEPDEFTLMLKKIQSDPGGATEKEAIELLTKAEEQGRAYAASLAMKNYLAHHAKPSPELMRMAAENAYRAGDYRAAVTRYKSYLRDVRPGSEASLAAARMYVIDIDLLRALDDAYLFMRTQGHRFRQTPEARTFDTWFLGEAVRRGDDLNLAARLAQVMEDKLPLEQERLTFWSHLDVLLDRIRQARDDQFGALPALRKIQPLIRDSKRRQAALAFYIENLDFHASSAGKDDVALEASFKKVARAAHDYVQTVPTADTLEDVVRVLAGGDGFSEAAWTQQQEQKRALFVAAFGKLSTDEQVAFLNDALIRHEEKLLAGDRQWTELALKHADAFKKAAGTRHVAFAYRGVPIDTLKKQAEVLADVPSRSAAVTKALATGGDLQKAVDHLVKEESWHLGFEEVDHLLANAVWPAWRDLHTKGEDRPDDDVWHRARADFGRKYFTQNPMAAFDPEGARRYFEDAWKALPHEKKSNIIGHLEAMAWVPYDDRDRNDAYNHVKRDIRGWAKWARKEVEEKEPKIDKKVLDQIGPILKTLDEVTGSRGDPAKAPNDLCRAFGEAVLAERNRNADAYNKAAGQVYPRVKDYTKVPCGATILRYIYNGDRRVDNFPAQLVALEDMLKGYNPDGENRGLKLLVSAIFEHDKLELYRIRREYQEHAEKLNKTFAAALERFVDKGRVPEDLFRWFAGTRVGDHWRHKEWGESIYDKIVAGKLLHKTDFRPYGDIASATVTYMKMVDDMAPGLAEKYPVRTYFDDMFVEEVRKTRRLDPQYWSFGQDPEQKVRNAAARILAGFDKLPYGYEDDADVVYSPSAFREWQYKALGADPKLRDAFVDAIEKAFGKTRFDAFAMGRARFRIMDHVADEESRAAFFVQLKSYVDRSVATPDRLDLPHMGAMFAAEDGGDQRVVDLTAEESKILQAIFPFAGPMHWREGPHHKGMAVSLHNNLVAAGQAKPLYEVIPHLWKLALDTRSDMVASALVRGTANLLDEGQFDLAYTHSSQGLEIARAELDMELRDRLKAVRSKSMGKFPFFIPVDRGDPLYAIYKAQAAYLTNRTDQAWDAYQAKPGLLMEAHKDLDPNFVIWIINQHTEFKQFEQAEKVAQAMLTWFGDHPGSFDAETRGRLQLAYAGIALEQKQYARAKALYQMIADDADFEGTKAKKDAQVAVADVLRQTRQYFEAIDKLEKLSRAKDPALQTAAFYTLAKVKFDQEEYDACLDYLKQVLARAPDHARAKTLQGWARIEKKQYQEPTELILSDPTRQRVIVPGKPLKITLQDKNLRIVGSRTNIEMRVWTDAGDEEFFNLVPFGDSRTKFRGTIRTELGPAKTGNGIVQLLGSDKLYYDFSDEFKQKQNLGKTKVHFLTVRSDGGLYASSGKILTEEERKAMELERQLRSRLGLEGEKTEQTALSKRRPANQVKPGNPINLRVEDKDRSATPKADTITVRVESSSGDSIARVELVETETHSGIFEGKVTTAAGQARAYAPNADPTKDPNMVISAKDYDPWVGLPGAPKPQPFTIDLNDNVSLDTLTINADVPGRKLTAFKVQTSLNARVFQTVGAYPGGYQPWNGKMRLEIARLGGHRAEGLRSVLDYREYMETGYIGSARGKVTRTIDRLAADWGEDIGGAADKLGINRHNRDQVQVVAHFKAAFYQDRRRVRTFQLKTQNDPKAVKYMLAVDGSSESRGAESTAGPILKRSLGKGVHVLDIIVVAKATAEPKFELHCDTPEPPYMVPCPAEMFDPAEHPQIIEDPKVRQEPAKITAADGVFTVTFPEGTQSRVVRLMLIDYETDAPALDKITLTDATGEAVLPTKQDFMSLRENQVLEIVPGDRITVHYEDPSFLTPGKEHLTANLDATYTNATVRASFVRYTTSASGQRTANYIPMRRFEPGDKVNVFINDPDMDVSEKRDTAKFTARTSAGETIEQLAIETESHSGVFVGGIFPVKEKTDRKSDLVVEDGDDIIIRYMDTENTDPGIPYPRTHLVEQVWYAEPEMRVFDITSRKLTDEELAEVEDIDREGEPKGENRFEEHVPVTRTVVATWPDEPRANSPATAMLKLPVLAEVLFPAVAKSPESTVEVFAQTSSGRDAAGIADPTAFDVSVPGTLRLVSRPSGPGGLTPPPGYAGVLVRSNPYALDPLADGRFTFTIPMELGDLPAESLALEEAAALEEEDQVLKIKGDDVIHLGFKYTDPEGTEHWKTRTVKLTADAFFDVMDRRYQEKVTGVYVGEVIYFRLIDPTRDTSDGKDKVTVDVTTTSGEPMTFELSETFSHSGVFKGLAKIVYTDEIEKAEGDGADRVSYALPVKYGDTIKIAYKGTGAEADVLERVVTVFKGSDGQVVPFTKRFEDDNIAMQVQFTIAEAYFELAKRHRELEQETLARHEILQGKKLLNEAIRDFPETEARAQAEYLLANLALEFAKDAKNEDIRTKHFMEAINRFTDIVASYPDSIYAPKAQFKKALVFEEMGEIDQASAEYVKLSYRYPDNELVAETIARLGQYFLTKGKQLKTKAEAKEDPIEREKVVLQSHKMFTTAGDVFSQLSERFPDHKLADKTMVLAAQCYMQGAEYEKSTRTFKDLLAESDVDKNLAAEAMYWCGHVYTVMADDGGVEEALKNAYIMFNKCQWDYPATKWARFARGRLTDPKFQGMGNL